MLLRCFTLSPHTVHRDIPSQPSVHFVISHHNHQYHQHCQTELHGSVRGRLAELAPTSEVDAILFHFRFTFTLLFHTLLENSYPGDLSCASRVPRCEVTTSNSIQDGGALVVNILVFDLRMQLQHCTYQRKTLLFALIKVSTFICKREISGLGSPLTNFFVYGERFLNKK